MIAAQLDTLEGKPNLAQLHMGYDFLTLRFEHVAFRSEDLTFTLDRKFNDIIKRSVVTVKSC